MAHAASRLPLFQHHYGGRVAIVLVAICWVEDGGRDFVDCDVPDWQGTVVVEI